MKKNIKTLLEQLNWIASQTRFNLSYDIHKVSTSS